MPELPEVQTTVLGLKRLKGLSIKGVWTSYNSAYYYGKETIKDPKYLKFFTKSVVGGKIVDAERRAKYILIRLDNGFSILAHLKMTGHFLYGKYEFQKSGNGKKDVRNSGDKENNLEKKGKWIPVDEDIPGLKDPFNRFIRFVLVLSNGKHLVLSDTRRFAHISIVRTKDVDLLETIKNLGPEPLSKEFTFSVFKKVLNKKRKISGGKIKTVLMDQTVISGIGNIYSDEILWRAGVHPEEIVRDISEVKLRALFESIKILLEKGIDFGGDSMSDFRNIDGEKGKFQNEHMAYRRKGEKCLKKGCGGVIKRIVVAGRSAHFCDKHQKISK
ncbi:MAG: bifunctional DNA-formamidopyrimidine glycosylase/DNA-(apurinic or apyrimidinic site) lyase [bacterium]|nr:bifunctional DNA-formamidopyrimidine glycosylase/DNA-(apurinic or apyrimidinic site) lyase [bacterium]